VEEETEIGLRLGGFYPPKINGFLGMCPYLNRVAG